MIETQPYPTYHPREYLSISTLLDFVRCPRRYYYKKCGLTPAGDEPSALIYGLAFHKAVPVALTTESIDETMEAFLSVWDGKLSTKARNAQRAYQQLNHFIALHSKGRSIYSLLTPPHQTIELDEKTSDWEVPFVLEVGLGVPIVGRIDGLVKHRDTGEHWGYELKTASRLHGLANALEFHPQLLTYALALHTLGVEVSGIMVEGVLVHDKNLDIITHPITVFPHHLDSILTWLRYWGGLLLECEKRELSGEHPPGSSFVQNWAGCTPYVHHYYPGWACEYQDLCRQEDWRTMLGFYDVKPDHKFVTLTKEGKNEA